MCEEPCSVGSHGVVVVVVVVVVVGVVVVGVDGLAVKQFS